MSVILDRISKALVLIGVLSGCSLGQSPLSQNQLTKSQANQIVGGEVVPAAEILDQSIAKSVLHLIIVEKEGKRSSCTSTLIDQDKVLTAAHCLYDSKGELFAYAHLRILNDPQLLETIKVSSVLVHPLYNKLNPDLRGYDIAVLKLSQPLPANYQPVSLAQPDDETVFSANWLAMGFGQTEVLNAPQVLRRVAIEQAQLTREKWPFHGNQKFSRRLIMDQTSQKGICYGDSGGPILAKKEQSWVLLGVTESVSDEPGASICAGRSFAASVIFHHNFIQDSKNVFDGKATGIVANDRYFNSREYKAGIDQADFKGASENIVYAKLFTANDPRSGVNSNQNSLVVQLVGESRKSCDVSSSISGNTAILIVFLKDLVPNIWNAAQISGLSYILTESKEWQTSVTQNEAISRIETDGRLNLVIDPLGLNGSFENWSSLEVRKTIWSLIDCRPK